MNVYYFIFSLLFLVGWHFNFYMNRMLNLLIHQCVFLLNRLIIAALFRSTCKTFLFFFSHVHLVFWCQPMPS
ncbi:hypothetical protein EDC94DRAFT_616198 [Helicostylum pulchrum]|nr:hypothetical protein EDC94DRAFT_616198 [Helicostylum pulchrum]